MILVFVYYYIFVTVQVMVDAYKCSKSNPLTWSISKNYTKDGGASFYFDYDFFQVCRIRIDADLGLWNVFQPNLTLSENGVILHEITLQQFTANGTKNHSNVYWPYYESKHDKFNCSKCIVSVKFNETYNSVAVEHVKRVAIKSISRRAISDHSMEERIILKGSMTLYAGIGAALVLIIIGLFIPMSLIIIRKRRANKKPSNASIMSHQENGLVEPTYPAIAIVKPRVRHGIEEPVYANCQPYRNQDEKLYDDTSATSRSNPPRKEDDEVIYCQVEVMNLHSKRIIKPTLEGTVYTKLTNETYQEPAEDGIIYSTISNPNAPQ